jgi:RNA polymerase sigma-70 factor (ECF subfamily)
VSSEISIRFPATSHDRIKLSAPRERGSDGGDGAMMHTAVETCPSSPILVPVSAHSLEEGPTDETLLERVSRADREALGLVFRRYARLVRVLAERILRDPGEAEDLVQEVFLFVFRKASLYNPARGSARSWLVQVTYHRAFDRRRYLTSRHLYSNLGLDEAIQGVQEPAALASFYDDTIEAALGSDALSRIEEVLSEVQRRVLHLHFYEGQTVQEIAAILGQSVANVRNHYYRALEKIRREVFTARLQDR